MRIGIHFLGELFQGGVSGCAMDASEGRVQEYDSFGHCHFVVAALHCIDMDVDSARAVLGELGDLTVLMKA